LYMFGYVSSLDEFVAGSGPFCALD